MNKIKIYSLLLGMATAWTACEVDEPIGVQSDNLTFVTAPEISAVGQSFYDLSDPENTEIDFSIALAGKESVDRIEVLQSYEGSDFKVVETISTFPADLSISLTEAMNLAGLTVDQLTAGDDFVYTFKVYSAAGSEYFTNTSFTASTTCVVQAPFEGTYTVTDDCELFFGTATLTKTSGNLRSFQASWDTFNGIGFEFDLVCEQIYVTEQSIGLGCGAGNNVDVVTAAVPGTFSASDDSQFTVNVNYSNAGCFGGFECSLTFTKQ
ncbi:hypothetical protein [Cesiribacter sp. SM1]|uniref:hypothetical protein n=1 Tax=Cesiribacter sp. SM1 TaxID=2861196 RepID=UPI001CD3860C|nr:hypothetical protein [Cesiribacter sp. SM1]